MKRTLNGAFTIMAHDPSITAWGWAIIDSQSNVVDMGCIKTEPNHKKNRIRKGDDSVRRLTEIANVICDTIKQHNVCCIVSELPHGSQSASAAIMIGAVTGLLTGLAVVSAVPIEWFSEADSKKALLQKNSATKQETIDAVTKILKVQWTGTKYKDEAIADALSVFHVASKQSSIIQYFLRNKSISSSLP